MTLDHLEETAVALLVSGGEALLLVAEVLVEGVAGDGGRLDDVRDRSCFVAAFGGDAGDRRKQAFALVTSDILGR
jgi:hypothetical protein